MSLSQTTLFDGPGQRGSTENRSKTFTDSVHRLNSRPKHERATWVARGGCQIYWGLPPLDLRWGWVVWIPVGAKPRGEWGGGVGCRGFTPELHLPVVASHSNPFIATHVVVPPSSTVRLSTRFYEVAL